jgi:hypothetical protein
MAPKKQLSPARTILPELSEEESAKLDTVCKKLLAKTANADEAAILGVEKAHYSVAFLNRMISVHGADGRVLALRFVDFPTVLEMLSLAGVDLSFNDGELLTKAVENGDWKAADYLVSFAGISPAKDELFLKALGLRNRDLFGVLLSGLKPADVGIWAKVAPALVAAEAWQMITDVWRVSKYHFNHILAGSELLNAAMKSGASYLSFCCIKQLAVQNVFPEFDEETSKPNKGLLAFIVKQFSAIQSAQLKLSIEQEEEEMANTTPLKPSALSTERKSEY